ATVSDPSTVDSETVVINWGDGSANDTFTSGVSGFTTDSAGLHMNLNLSHTYVTATTFPVTMTITDDDGGAKVVNSTITVKAAAIQADPLDSTKTALVVGGTSGDDTIKFSVNSNGRTK